MQISNIKTESNIVEVIIDGRKYAITSKNLQKGLDVVYAWQYYNGTNFSSILMGLIAKADEINRGKLLKSFPEYVIAYLLWFYKGAESDTDFFKRMREELSC